MKIFNIRLVNFSFSFSQINNKNDVKNTTMSFLIIYYYYYFFLKKKKKKKRADKGRYIELS